MPPREPTPLERGEPLKITFEDFDLDADFFAWPQNNRASIVRNKAKVIDGRASLMLSSPGGPWNTANFKGIEIPPGMRCSIAFDCRAVETKEGGYLYYLLTRGKNKSKLTRVRLQTGQHKRVTGTVSNEHNAILTLTIGFHKGGTYVIDNLELHRIDGGK